MATQDNKTSLSLLADIIRTLGCQVKVRSTIPNGFTFVPCAMSCPDAFCKLYESGLAFHTMNLCQAKSGQYWIEITYAHIPSRIAKYWDGKKYKVYS